MSSGIAPSAVMPPAPPVPTDSRDREKIIQQQLYRTGLQVRFVDLASSVAIWIIGVLILFIICALVDSVVGLGVVGRFAALAVLVACTLWYLVFAIGPLLVRAINPAYAALTIEEATPTLKNSLINFLLLRQDRSHLREIVYQAVEKRAAADIAAVPVEAIVDRSRLVNAGYVLCVVLAFFAGYKILSPKDPFQTVARVLAPWAEIARPSRVQIVAVEPGSAEIYYGQVVPVFATVRGVRDGDKVLIRYTTADGQSIDAPVEMKLAAGDRYECQLPPAAGGATESGGLLQNVTYRVIAGDAESFPFRLSVVSAPTIIVDRLDYEYPAYTNKAPDFVTQQGDIKSLEGTKVTIHTRANHPIKSAWIELDPTNNGAPQVIPLTVEDDHGQGKIVLQLKPDRQTPWHATYQVRFYNQRSQRSEKPILHRIEVLRDLAPEVQILRPDRLRVEVPEDGEEQIEVRALDPDYGLAKLRSEGVVAGKPPLSIDLLTDNSRALPQVTVSYLFRPREHNLKAGDELRFAAVAEDNRTDPLTSQPEPNVARTREYTLIVTAPRNKQDGQRGQQPDAQPQAQPNQKTDNPRQEKLPQKSQPNQNSKTPPQPNQNNQQKTYNGQKQQSPGQQQSDQQKPDQPQQDQQPQNKPDDGQKENQQPKNQPQQPGGEQQKQDQQKSSEKSQRGQQSNDQQQPSGGQQQPGNQQADQQNQSPQASQKGEGNQQTGEKSGGHPQNGQQQNGEQGNQQQGQSGARGGSGASQAQENPGASRDQGNRSQGNQSAGQPNNNGEKSGQPAENSQHGQNPQPGSKAGLGDNDGKAQHDGQAFERLWEKLKDRFQKGGNNDKSQPENLQPDNQAEKPPADQHSGSQPQASGASGAQNQNVPNAGRPEGNDQQPGGSQKDQQPQGKAGDPNQRLPDDREGQNPTQQPSGGNKGGAPQGGSKTDKGDKSTPGKGEDRDPGAAKNSDEGAGQASQDKTASGFGQDKNRDVNKDLQPPNNRPEKGDPSAGSNSKKQSDSKGGESGDLSGGGKKGPGQSGAQEGNDSAGSKSAGDQGIGKADETGAGETGTKAGNQQKAAGQTGKPGDQAGDGSFSQPGEKGSSAGAKGSPTDTTGGPASNVPAGQPARDKGAARQQPQGGEGNSQQLPPEKNELDEEADAANLEYARQATEMVLRHLKDEEHNPDPELLDKLGWTKEDLAEFLRRWDALQKSADESPNGKRDLDEALKSLGLRDPASKRRAGGKTSDHQRDLRDAGNRTAPPPRYREQFDAFRKAAARSVP